MARQPTPAVAIELGKLEEGLNEVTLEVSAEALELEWPNATFPGSVALDLRVIKMMNDLQVDGTFEGGLQGACDRCLEPFEGGFEGSVQVLVRKGDAASHELGNQDGIVFYDGPVLDLSDEVRQALLLGLSIQMVCSENCQGLCAECGINKNVESCTCATKAVNPQWAALARLRDQS